MSVVNREKGIFYRGMPRSILYLALAFTVSLTWLLYYCIGGALSGYFEAATTLPRMELGLHYDLRLYKDIWWPYGPTLYYIPKWFMATSSWFGVSIEVGYVVSHIVLLCAGVWGMFFLIDQLRIKVVYRCILFVILAIAAHIWTMGASHTIARHVFPYILLVAIHRATLGAEGSGRPVAIGRLCGLSILGSLATMSISPEVGLSLIVGLLAYFGQRVLLGGRKWIFPLGSCLISLPIWLFLFPGCFSFAGSFSSGAGCNPVVPAAHILFYLGSLFLILPLMLRAVLFFPRHESAPLLAAWAAMVLVTIPPSLSRCDSTHVVWNGIGLFIIAFAVVVRCWPKALPAYAVLMLIILGIAQHFGNALALPGCLQYVRSTLAGKRIEPNSEPSPLIKLLDLDEFSSIAAPFGLDGATRSYLFSTHRYVPQYHLDLSCIVSEADVRRVAEDLRRASVVLVPESILSFRGAGAADIAKFKEVRQNQIDDEESNSLGTTYFYPFPIHSKRPGFDGEVDLAEMIGNEYQVLKKAGGWALMTR